MSAQPTPRPGSSLGKAVTALKANGGPMARQDLAAAAEIDPDDIDSLLRYGVRMGMLVLDGSFYALGNGVPLEPSAPAALPPAPASPFAVEHVRAAPVVRPPPSPALEVPRFVPGGVVSTRSAMGKALNDALAKGAGVDIDAVHDSTSTRAASAAVDTALGTPPSLLREIVDIELAHAVAAMDAIHRRIQALEELRRRCS